ncbi:transporter substrate-binding domain-containing protein [Magnetococcales bacterium HHB-1]
MILSWSEVITALKEKRLDMAPVLGQTPERDKFLRFTKPYVETPTVIVTRKEGGAAKSLPELKGHRVALVDGYATSELMLKSFPEIKPVMVNNNLEALAAVRRGAALATVGDMAVISHLMNEHDMKDLTISGIAGLAVEPFHMGVRKDWPILVSILDRALETINIAEHRRIKARWLLTNESKRFQTWSDLDAKERAWIIEHPQIRVGAETDWPPLDFVENGEPQGYALDLLRLVAAKTGLNLAFEHGYSWSQLMKRFRAKKLDLLPAVVKTAERTPFMRFSRHYLTLPSVIVTQAEQSKIRSLRDLKGRRLAVINDFYYVKILAEKHPEINLHKVQGTLQGLEAVLNGQADAFIGSQVVIDQTLKQHALTGIRVAGFSGLDVTAPMRLRFGVHKDQTTLVSILNKGLEAITPEDLTRLYDQWISASTPLEKHASQVLLTAEEQNWLSKHVDIRLGVDSAWPPFEFVDEQGAYRGLCADYVRLINERLKVNMKPVKARDWSDVIKKAKVREIDLFPCISQTDKRKKYLKFAQSHITIPWMIITRKNAPLIAGIWVSG